MGGMGLNIYFGNRWQQAFAHKNEASFQRYINISLTIYASISSVLSIFVLAFVFFGVFSSTIFFSVLEPTDGFFVFLLLVGMQISHLMRGGVSEIYRGRSQFFVGIFLKSITTLVIILGAVIAALLGAGPVSVAVMYLLCDLVAGWGIMLFDLHRRFPHLRFQPQRLNASEFYQMLHYGKWFSILQGVPVAWTQAPVLILGVSGLNGALIVSFILTRTLANFSQQVTDIFVRSVSVEMITAFHLDNKDQLTATLVTFGLFLSSLTGSIVGGLFMFAAPVISNWSGESTLYNPWIFFWFLLPSLLVCPALPLRSILELANLPRPVASARLFQVVLGLLLCTGLSSTHGPVGAAAGLAVGEALGLGLLLPIIGYRHIGNNYWNYYVRCLWRFLLAGGWSALCAVVLLNIVQADHSVFLLFASGFLWSLFGFMPVLFFATPVAKRSLIFQKIVRCLGIQYGD